VSYFFNTVEYFNKEASSLEAQAGKILAWTQYQYVYMPTKFSSLIFFFLLRVFGQVNKK